ncbi:hypothetical protein IC582_005212 [Cucumis melo]
MFDVTRVRREGERKLVEYNKDGVSIGENGAKLNSFIDWCVHYHIRIIYATWIDVPAELKEKIYTIVEKNIPSKESELDRASMWKKARVDKKGQYDNEDVQEVVNRIDEISKTCADKEPSPNDVLTQALGTRESSGRARGVGGFVTPSTYFHTAKHSKK